MDKIQQFIIVKIIDEYTVVINKGSADGIKSNQRFLIYSLDGEPIIDPITKETLGTLEIVKGTAKVKHIQEHLTTLESDKYSKPTRTITKQKNPFIAISDTITEQINDDSKLMPLDEPVIGDHAKIIS